MKKHPLFISRYVMLAAFLVATVVANAFDDGRYSFTITKNATDTEAGEVTVNAKKGETYSGVVSFPSVAYDSKTEKWYDVTAIGSGIFQNNTDITELDMEDKLLKIRTMGSNAFAGCVSLKKILIHGGIETVGSGAFKGCTSLEDVTIGYGVVNFGSSSGYGVFQGCTSLKTIEIPYTVKYLGYKTFSGCTSLENVTLNSGLETMGDHVFDGCSALPSIVIPNTVETIGQSCFVGCSNLTKATLGAKISEMGSGLFKNDAKLSEVIIQDGCSVISSSAFQGCLALKEIVIPGSVKWIQQTAFAGCTKLESVTMGEGVLYLGTNTYNTGVFDGCTSLKNVVVPSTLINIHHYAFRGCSSLENITLNEGLQYMGEHVFDGCSALQSIVIPNTVEKIGQSCFVGCSSLTKATLGAKISEMGIGLFKNDAKLAEVTIQNGCSIISSNTFQGCLALKEIVIPGSVEWIQQTAFAGCTKLESVTMGEGVLYLGTSTYNTGVFDGCTSLKNVVVPSTLINIHHYAFRDCSSLENITLNEGLQYMGDHVFDGCSALQSIVIPNTVEKIGQSCFVGCSSLTKATLGAKISEMGDGLFKNDAKLAEVTIQNGCSIISSNTFQGCLALKEIVIPGSVEWIQQTAFAGCTSLESATIEEGVLYLGTNTYNTGVFDGCSSLKNVVVPSTLINIHHYAFRGCSSLENITLNEGLQYMGDHVFDGCSALQSIVIPNTVEKIGQSCFVGCSSLTKATLGAKISEMGDGLFKNDAKLAEVTIQNGCSIISSNTFQGCLALKEIVIPGSVEWIQQTAFAGCTSLESATIEEGVLYLGTSTYNTGVFEGCTQLSQVQLPSTLKNVHHYTFRNCTNLRRITCYAPMLPTLGTDVWSNSAQPKATLYVPESALADYLASTQWNGFKNIWPIGKTGGEDVYGECDLVDLPSNSPYFDAAAFLCDRTVLSGSKVNGLVAVGDEIQRGQLAKVAFRGLYLLNGVTYPTYLASDYFPTCYQDINTLTADNEYYYQAARALLYLDYGDGVTPFDRNRLSFNPDGRIERIHVLKVLMETFNIAPDVSNTNNPFPDDEQAQHLLKNQPRKFGYLRKAASLGIIDKATTDSPDFNPYAWCTRGDAFLWLYRIMSGIESGNKNFSMPVPDETAYFEPLNMTLKTLALGLNFQMGNFSHYTKSSFAISGVVPLTFAHTYNSYHTAIDDVFFGQRTMEYVDVTYRPLSAGWSHSYDSYVTMVGTGTARRAIVHWGDGSIHVYKPSGSGYKAESVGVYDNLSVSGTVATIKTKGQSVYKFEQLEGGDSPLYYMTEVSDRNSNKLTVRYTDGQHGMKVISSVTDGTRQLTFDYLSGTNLVSSVTDPLDRKIQFTYTYNKQLDEYFLTKFTDAKGNVTTYSYGNSTKLSTARLLSKIQLPKGNYIENQYDQNRRLTQTVSGKGSTPTTKTSLSVAATYGQDKDPFTTSQITVEREGTTSTYNYEMNHNNTVTHMTGNLDLETTMSYDDSDEDNPHLPVAMQSNATTVDNIKYDKRGNVLSITVSGNNGVGSLTRSMTYDDMNNLTSITDAKGNKTTFTYDTRGNLVKVEAPEGVVSTMEVDDRGLTTKTVNPMGVETQYQYNGYGNMIHALLPVLNLKTTTEYDAVSRVTAAYDALNRKTAYAYDKNDNLLTVTDANSKTTSYAYDKNDNMVSVTNASGRATTLSYDNATDWLTSVSFGGFTKKYEYNKDGSLKACVKPDGTRLDYTYDDLGRVKNDGVNEYVYDSKMRVESVSTPQSKITFGYDGFNRTTMVDYEAGSTFNTVRYEYDDNSNVTAVEYPNGQRVTYTYDALNRMTSLTDWKGNTVSYTYRKDSKPLEVTYPNGMITKYVYDAAARLVGKETKIPGAMPGDLNQDGVADVKDVLLLADCIVGKNLDYLVYEAADLNGDEKIDVSDMVTEIALVTQGNDSQASALHRALREAGYKDLASYSFKLDNVGNIIEQEAIEPFKAIYEPAAQIGYTYNAANRITRAGNANFEFDANGNTTKRTEDSVAELYTWNKSDQLVNADGVEIEYDPLGLIRRYGDTEYTVSPLGNGDVLGDSKTGNSYIYGAGLEARIDKNGNVSYYVTDMRGSVIAIVDMDGKVTHRYQYDDFGRVVQSEEKDFNPFRYVGKYGVMYNTATHYYMRARHYDPTIGRFLSEDPIWSTNLYPYCDNNPIMGIDPQGEKGLDATRGYSDVAEQTAGAAKHGVKVTTPPITEAQKAKTLAEIAKREAIYEKGALEAVDKKITNFDLDKEFTEQVNTTFYTALPLSFAISMYQGDVIEAYNGIWRDAYWTALGTSAARTLGSGPAFMITLVGNELYSDIQAGKGYSAFSAEQYDAVFHRGGLLTRAVGYYGDACQWAGQQIGKGILGIYNYFK